MRRTRPEAQKWPCKAAQRLEGQPNAPRRDRPKWGNSAPRGTKTAPQAGEPSTRGRENGPQGSAGATVEHLAGELATVSTLEAAPGELHSHLMGRLPTLAAGAGVKTLPGGAGRPSARGAGFTANLTGRGYFEGLHPRTCRNRGFSAPIDIRNSCKNGA